MKEALILAGGLGTRLKSEVPNNPKCMASVCDRPFIDYVVAYLHSFGVTRFIFALGYMSEVLIDHISTKYSHLDCDYVVESEPLGTGGAIKLAMSKSITPHPMVLNGDSLFEVDIAAMMNFYLSNDSMITCALKPMLDFSRYGTVQLKQNGRIAAFEEKTYCETGLINGGVYIIDRNKWTTGFDYPQKFSFEKSVLEVLSTQGRITGFVDDGYFIDIGIPEDYQRAQLEFKSKLSI